MKTEGYEEYTVELYKDNGFHVSQIDVFDTYEEAQEYIDANPADDAHCYSIFCIEYDENGEERDSYPVY